MYTLDELTPERRMVVRRAIRSYQNLLYRSRKEKNWGRKSAQIWEKCQSLDEVHLLANGMSSSMEGYHKEDISLFEMAVSGGRWNVCLDLLEHGANPALIFSNHRYLWSSLLNAMTKLGWSSLKEEVYSKPLQAELEDFFLFLQKVAPKTPPCSDKGEWGSVQNIVMLRNPYVVLPSLKILQSSGHSLDMQDSIGETGFLLACWQCDPELIRWFASQGVNLEAKTKGGWDAWAMTIRDSTILPKYEPEFMPRLFEGLDALKETGLPFDKTVFAQMMEKYIHRVEDRTSFEAWLWTRTLPQASHASGKVVRI